MFLVGAQVSGLAQVELGGWAVNVSRHCVAWKACLEQRKAGGLCPRLDLELEF